MRKFDIDKALNGEPVMLRNRYKAYIYCVVPNYVQALMPDNPYILIGAIFDPFTNECTDSSCTWMRNGTYMENSEQDTDIVGMWSNNGKF